MRTTQHIGIWLPYICVSISIHMQRQTRGVERGRGKEREERNERKKTERKERRRKREEQRGE